MKEIFRAGREKVLDDLLNYHFMTVRLWVITERVSRDETDNSQVG